MYLAEREQYANQNERDKAMHDLATLTQINQKPDGQPSDPNKHMIVYETSPIKGEYAMTLQQAIELFPNNTILKGGVVKSDNKVSLTIWGHGVAIELTFENDRVVADIM